jgi:hypothetical protein
MAEFVVNETTVWGHHYKARNMDKKIRLLKKSGILQSLGRVLFLDHMTIYALKEEGQRGPAREAQTFIAAYPYKSRLESGDPTCRHEREFIEQLTSIQLRFYKEPILFRGVEAFKVLVMDTDVDQETVLRLLPLPKE